MVQMAELELDETRLGVLASINAKDYIALASLLGNAAEAPHDATTFVALAERPGGLVLQYCCGLFQDDCTNTELWAVIQAAAKAYFDAQVTNVPNEMANIEASIAKFTSDSGHEGMYAVRAPVHHPAIKQ